MKQSILTFGFADEHKITYALTNSRALKRDRDDKFIF